MPLKDNAGYINAATADKDFFDCLSKTIARSNLKSLVKLLDEKNLIYAGRGTNQIIRAKGFIMASFMGLGLPGKALPFILEELENGKHPYLIAGAARALRGSETPLIQTLPYLFKSISNLTHGDDTVSFENINEEWATQKVTSARKEIFETFKWFGSYAKEYTEQLKALLDHNTLYFNKDTKKLIIETIASIEGDTRQVAGLCCDVSNPGHDFSFKKYFIKTRPLNAEEIVLEDQTGNIITYEDFFAGKPTVVAFFYTRCDNPNKCSLTITKLSQLQKQLQEKKLDSQVKIAAVTYDRFYDEPFRIRHYCENRQMKFNDDCRSFRVVNGFDALKQYLGLGVNHIGSFVSKHTIEIYIIDKSGRVHASFTRLQWNNDIIIQKLDSLLHGEKTVSGYFKKTLQNISSVLLSAGVAFFPKCPLCCLAYLSAFGITGANAIRVSSWLLPLTIIFLSINVFVLWKRCKSCNVFLPLYLSCAGIILLLSGHFVFHYQVIAFIGLGLIFFGTLFNSILPKLILNRP